MTRGFPAQQPDVLYLTEGGQETEIMYKFGQELPEFALFALLGNPAAMTALVIIPTPLSFAPAFLVYPRE